MLKNQDNVDFSVSVVQSLDSLLTFGKSGGAAQKKI